MQQFQIRQDDFSTTRIVDEPGGNGVESSNGLSAGTVLAKVDRFAVTANNVTYAATGDRIGYWQFFPPIGNGEGDADGWGVVPVWGFADVIASATEGVAVGERLFGYWPPASELVLTPVRITDQHFFDGAEHRAQLPSGYNMYRRVQAEADYSEDHEPYRMLLWPLFITSFCLADALEDNGWFGAEQVLILSASSKTSIGLAYGLAASSSAPRTIGITSARNLSMVQGLGLYDTAVTYDQVEQMDNSVPTVIVDMSGNGEVMGRLHGHLGEQMRKTFFVGLTHWDKGAPNPDLIQDRSEFFFAPSHIERRMKEWTPAVFAQRSSDFVMTSAAKTRDWLRIETIDGLDGLANVFDDVCNGRVAADRGLIVSL